MWHCVVIYMSSSRSRDLSQSGSVCSKCCSSHTHLCICSEVHTCIWKCNRLILNHNSSIFLFYYHPQAVQPKFMRFVLRLVMSCGFVLSWLSWRCVVLRRCWHRWFGRSNPECVKLISSTVCGVHRLHVFKHDCVARLRFFKCLLVPLRNDLTVL